MLEGPAAAESGVVVLERELLAPRRPWWRTAFRLAVRKPLGTLSVIIITVLVVCAVGAPVLSRYDPEHVLEMYDPATGYTTIEKNGPPSGAAWFGTDTAGRDTYARVIWGARRSLQVGLISLAMGTAIGVVIALVSAYGRGAADLIIQRFMDAFQAFPPILFLILAVTVAQPTIRNLIIALGIIAVPSVQRIVRSVVIQIREMPYVEAARAIGASAPRIMALHILPNIMAPIIIVFSIGIGVVILAEASLSFLMLAPPGVSWGWMLSEGRNFVLTSPWQALFSGLAITLAVLGFNLAGDALRDILDPRLRV